MQHSSPTIKIILLFASAALIILLVVTSINSHSLRTGAGPENNGLRLHLRIDSTYTDIDQHTITLTLINASRNAITLETHLFGGPKAGQKFADTFAESTYFSSHPYIMRHPFSIGGGSDLPELIQSIPAGASVQSTWTVSENTFEGFETTTSLTLPMNGLYFLRAHLTVWTVDDKQIDLWSNEAPCSVGGSLKAPNKCSAKINSVADDQSVMLDIGTLQEVEIGDKFSAIYYAPTHLSADTRWVFFEVKEVHKNVCRATPLPDSRLAGHEGANPWFPDKGFEVFLVPPPQVIRPNPQPAKPLSKDEEWPETNPVPAKAKSEK